LAVEIGVFGGKSLCAIGSAMKLNGLGRAVGIDPWSVLDCVEDMHKPENVKWWTENSQLDEMYNQCLHYVATLGLKETVGIIRDQSQRAVTFFVDGSIDLLHIDGNHSAIPAMRDGQLYLPKVKPGGLIICDDEGWTERGADGVESLSVRPMIEWLKKNGCTEIEVGFGCSMLVKRIVA
jgi:predicted O-methyltransferase YrrM